MNLEESYNPPDIALPNDVTQYTYNLDKQLTLITRPDGQTVNLGYDTNGRLQSVIANGATQSISYAYNSTTGNLSTITAPRKMGSKWGQKMGSKKWGQACVKRGQACVIALF